MSKKNTPKSIYPNKKKIADVITYTIDGTKYRETISADGVNGDLGKSTKIEKLTTSFKDVNININPLGIPSQSYEVVTNKEELKSIQNNEDRMNKYGQKLLDYKNLPGGEEALDASGMKTFTDTFEKGSSWSNIPLPENSDTASVKNDKDAIQKISPKEIFGNYKEIFKKHLKYPRDMFIGKGRNVLEGTSQIGNPFIEGTGEGSQDYFFIEQFLYKAPQAGVIEAEGGAKSFGKVLKTGIGRRTNLGDPMGSCILPIPNKLGVSQGVSWGEGRANATELGAFQAANDTVRRTLGESNNLGDVIRNVFTGGRKQVTSTFKELTNSIRNQDGTANAGAVINAVIARSLLSRIGINVDINQFITRETGAAINPNLELLFGGPQLRTFSFVFNFAPNDVEEAREVRMIQRWFRQGMLPQKLTNFEGGSLFLGSPNIFRLCYKNNMRRIKGLNTFKICAVTSVQVDFTPDGVYQSYEDEKAVSQPVRSTMAVTFNELTPIFANDYNLDETTVDDPSLDDLGLNISGSNEIAEDDLGF